MSNIYSLSRGSSTVRKRSETGSLDLGPRWSRDQLNLDGFEEDFDCRVVITIAVAVFVAQIGRCESSRESRVVETKM